MSERTATWAFHETIEKGPIIIYRRTGKNESATRSDRSPRCVGKDRGSPSGNRVRIFQNFDVHIPGQ